MYFLVMPLGIITYLSLIFTILLGKRIIKINFKYHKFFAIFTLVMATFHAGIIIANNYF